MNRAASFAEAPPSYSDTIEGNKQARSRRNGLLCAVLAGAALLATYPVAEMGMVDDWSYTKTALDFARTGHFLYNGWATAMLGWQIPWAALFIKLFGFSFTVVRFSTLPVAMASVYLFHQILVRFGIAPRLAVFGALTLGLSPLFVPLAASFMTDIPGLFVILLCIYMCQRAVAAKSDRSALLWLLSAALLNVAGGTVRQIAWLGALVMAPATAWLLRRRRGMLPAAIAMWVISVIAIFWLMHWFNQQPYSISKGIALPLLVHPATYAHLMTLLLKALLCLTLIVLPSLAAWAPGARRLNRTAWIHIAIFMAALTASYSLLGIRGKLEGNVMPWIGHVLGWQGIIPSRSGYMLGAKPVTLGVSTRLAISLIVVLSGLIFARQMWDKRGRLQEVFSHGKMRSSWRAALWILGPFALSYMCLLLPLAIQGIMFDRYLLPLMVVAVTALLKLYQQEAALRLPAVSWVVLMLFAIYTVAATHDSFALNRARVFAANEIMASGVPRTGIQGGFDYDGWTQIQNGRHINNPFFHPPAGTYDVNVRPLPLAPDCRLLYSNWMPAVKPKYFLTFERMDCLAPSEYSSVPYRSWLPPFHRKLYIQQFPENMNK